MILHTGPTKSFRGLSLSNALIVQQHPQVLMEEIVARWRTELIFTYSRYEVAQPGLQASAPRTPPIRVHACDVTPDWLIDRLAELPSNEEMAWHSWVECRGSGFHIPMIDFVGRPSNAVLCEIGRLWRTPMCLNGRFALFETGRSLHGYFPDLIQEEVWFKYLGQLLTLNEHNHPDVIDTRWVGHALMRGFAALRRSHNTNRYQAMPRLASFAELPDMWQGG